MPKMKTSKTVAKRFKVSKSGKVLRRRCGKSHLLTSKSPKRRRNLRKDIVMGEVGAQRILTALGRG